VLGKTVTAEFATDHPGPTTNPRNPAHTPGGSSSGSAAVVADGQADLALGTQTAGSVIRPASFCGTFGFKPTFGRYPLRRGPETAPSLDTLGLFGRDLAVITAADAVLSGEHAAPAAKASLTVGLCRSPAWDAASPQMQATFHAFAETLRVAGHRLVPRELPAPFRALLAAQILIHRREASMVLGHIRREHAAQVSPAFIAMIDAGAAESEAELSSGAGLAAPTQGPRARGVCRGGPAARARRRRRSAARPRGHRRSGVPAHLDRHSARPASASLPPGKTTGCRWGFRSSVHQARTGTCYPTSRP